VTGQVLQLAILSSKKSEEAAILAAPSVPLSALRRLKERVDAGEEWRWHKYRHVHLESHMTRRWINRQLQTAPPGATPEEVSENVAAHRKAHAESDRVLRQKGAGNRAVPDIALRSKSERAYKKNTRSTDHKNQSRD
jgi:hypothetical protein